MNKKTSIKTESGRIDWMITILPLAMVVIMSLLFFLFHEQTNLVISRIRYVLGDTFGIYYLIIGLGIFVLTLYVAGSKYGYFILLFFRMDFICCRPSHCRAWKHTGLGQCISIVSLEPDSVGGDI